MEQYRQSLVWKTGEEMDLDLLDETRQLLYGGKLLQDNERSFGFGRFTELSVLLFDNYLVVTEAKVKNKVTSYHVCRRPIPLELLVLRFDGSPMKRYNRTVFPCELHNIMRDGENDLLFAESDEARAHWKAKLEEAISLRKLIFAKHEVFSLTTLSKDHFAYVPQASSTTDTSDQTTFVGKIQCTIPLKAAGRDLVAVGGYEGVWFGFHDQPSLWQRVLHLKNVTQCAFLERFGIFLVLGDKSLLAYHIEALVPMIPPSDLDTPAPKPQQLSKDHDVEFFSVGKIGGRTLVIYMRKKGVDSIFRALEVDPETFPDTDAAQVPLPESSQWFRVYKDFFMVSIAHNVIFLKTKIVILSNKGMEVMDLDEFKSVCIPDSDDKALAPIVKRLKSRKPLGMSRVAQEEFLLCYDEFGIYVNQHGNSTSRQLGVIRWECVANRVAFHSSYVILFSPRSIEIRRVTDGRLVQILQGTDIVCTWDGKGHVPRSEFSAPTTSSEKSAAGSGNQDTSLDDVPVRIQGVMRADGSNPGTTSQHLFEFVPI
ncbi:hypothetical protein DL93DRAFT_2166131 [Clavulina sp. PMI_390]|nr:hypothetical protein DL93DRAFT_2166131 [Clavulina sp. PMI_390]